MKKISIILAALAMLSLSSCRFVKVSSSLLESDGDGKIIVTASDKLASKDTTVGEFNSLSCALACNVVYTSGACAVSLSAPDNIIGLVNIENKDGKLIIGKDNKIKFKNLRKVTLTVSCPELESIEFFGAVDFSAPEGISTTDFSVDANGAADMDINGLKAGNVAVRVNGAADIEINDLDCTLLRMDVNGAGDIELSGRADKATAVINGAGDIDASDLDCKDFSSKANGMGSVKRPK